MTDRKSLTLTGLDDMKPREPGRAPVNREVIESASTWKSREAPAEVAQINIRGDKAVIDRYKALCEAHGRRTYLEMLEILMDRMDG